MCEIYYFAVKYLVSLSAARVKHLICSVILLQLSEYCLNLMLLLCLMFFFVQLLFYVDFHVCFYCILLYLPLYA